MLFIFKTYFNNENNIYRLFKILFPEIYIFKVFIFLLFEYTFKIFKQKVLAMAIIYILTWNNFLIKTWEYTRFSLEEVGILFVDFSWQKRLQGVQQRGITPHWLLNFNNPILFYL